MQTFTNVSSRSDGELAGFIQAAAPGAARREEAELCRRLGKRVRLFGLSRLRDRSTVDDLVQRVLISRGRRSIARAASSPYWYPARSTANWGVPTSGSGCA